jgi:hypothetical protein
LNYTQTTSGYKVEEKLHLGVREQKRLNTTVIKVQVYKPPLPATLQEFQHKLRTAVKITDGDITKMWQGRACLNEECHVTHNANIKIK